jgi:hypothetical protein
MKLDVEAARRQFERWRHAIALAEQHAEQFSFPDAVVAGGAIRDTLLGREVRDIDVFTDTELVDTEGFERIVSPPNTCSTIDDDKYDSKAVWVNRAEGIDIIYTGGHELESYVADKFRCNISKVWFDGQNIVLTAAFIDGVSRQILEFAPGTSPEYVAKIRKKYPEFQVRDADWD